MSYTICDKFGEPKPIRIIVPDANGIPQLKAEFIPYWWVCDPCNPPNKRYEVTYRSDQDTPQYFHWYEIATADDTVADIKVKIEHYKRVIAARDAMDKAAAEYRRLTNCGWSICPPNC